ncbi:MAG: trypsin-like peptidase domain-containing protein [Clostridia bacterium]|nr:trypsin-like peptidase domain-containing protein [Clostridia bacterium]
MSFRSDFKRDKIYDEMDKNHHTSAGGVFSKLLSIALFLAIGFSAGSIYSTFSNKLSVHSEQPNIPTSSNNTLIASSTPIVKGENSGVVVASLSNVVAKTADSVVEITEYSTARTYFNSSYTAEGNGSGVIISTDGYILTNNHVISGAEKITVRLRNGEEYEAELIGKDSKTDIAIIKIEATNLTPATIGDSSKTLVGDFVLAIGNPLGKLGGTVTYGYVSALERELDIDGSTKNLMQVDAAVNPGNSGGGLFNINGELIGIVNAKSTGSNVEGLGFAIPINDVHSVIEDILTHGYATNRPFLGVSLSNSAYSSRNSYGSIWDYFYQQTQYGAAVESVLEDSPAEKAGIQKGDIIISIDGKVISSASEVTAEVSEHEVGEEIEIGLIRDNRTKTVKVTLEEYKGQ